MLNGNSVWESAIVRLPSSSPRHRVNYDELSPISLHNSFPMNPIMGSIQADGFPLAVSRFNPFQTATVNKATLEFLSEKRNASIQVFLLTNISE